MAIKIDVEGSDFQVLRGALSLPRPHRPLIVSNTALFELSSDQFEPDIE